MINACTSMDTPGWLALRCAMWPEETPEEHLAEMARFIAKPDRYAQYVAYDESRAPVGFVEIALRHDYVNGTSTSPVAFLEAIYVSPASRRRGVARALIGAAESWARQCGCSEFASDASVENAQSYRMHRSLGFEETERVVYFRKALRTI